MLKGGENKLFSHRRRITDSFFLFLPWPLGEKMVIVMRIEKKQVSERKREQKCINVLCGVKGVKIRCRLKFIFHFLLHKPKSRSDNEKSLYFAFSFGGQLKNVDMKHVDDM